MDSDAMEAYKAMVQKEFKRPKLEPRMVTRLSYDKAFDVWDALEDECALQPSEFAIKATIHYMMGQWNEAQAASAVAQAWVAADRFEAWERKNGLR